MLPLSNPPAEILKFKKMNIVFDEDKHFRWG